MKFYPISFLEYSPSIVVDFFFLWQWKANPNPNSSSSSPAPTVTVRNSIFPDVIKLYIYIDIMYLMIIKIYNTLIRYYPLYDFSTRATIFIAFEKPNCFSLTFVSIVVSWSRNCSVRDKISCSTWLVAAGLIDIFWPFTINWKHYHMLIFTIQYLYGKILAIRWQNYKKFRHTRKATVNFDLRYTMKIVVFDIWKMYAFSCDSHEIWSCRNW